MNCPTPFGTCCMRADCPDQDCPGVEIARLFQQQGGERVQRGKTVETLRTAEFNDLTASDRTLLGLWLAACLAFCCSVAYALGFDVFLPF